MTVQEEMACFAYAYVHGTCMHLQCSTLDESWPPFILLGELQN